MFLLPHHDSEPVGGTWAPLDAQGNLAPSAASVLDDPLSSPFTDADFVEDPTLGGVGSLACNFVYPRDFHTGATYSDGNTIVDRMRLVNFTVNFRARTIIAGVYNVELVVVDPTLGGAIIVNDFTINTTTFKNYSFATLNPFTAAEFLPEDLPSRTGPDETTLNHFYFLLRSSAASNKGLRISRLWLTWDQTIGAPGGRARLGPMRMEPAYYCSLCSLPFHRSSLTRMEDPRHPFYGHLLCEDDIDDLNPEPTFPRTTEGEFDPDDF